MSQTSNPPQPGSGSTDDSVSILRAPLPAPERQPSRALQNWAYFGAAIMAFMGVSWAVLGLIALGDDEFFSVRTNELLALQTYTAWGWVHLLGGLLALTAGVGILWGGRRWARNLGIVVAFLSAVVNFGFLAASPLWAAMVIALDVVVIYALAVHGAEIES